MKLSDLGLSTKPQTKYFEGGYVSFMTVNGVLYYKIYRVGKIIKGILLMGMVEDKTHFTQLMSYKNISEAVQA